MGKGTRMDITVIDEHHEAFLFWHEVLASKGAPRTLVHVDGHPDMGVPWLTESVYTKDVTGFVERQLNIADFIIPAVMRGYFDHVVYLGRGFEKKKRKKDRVGTLYGKGMWIRRRLKRDRMTKRLFPDAREWCLTSTPDPAATPRRPVILDIDLDYFCGYFLNYSEVVLPLSARQLRSLDRLDRSDDRFGIQLRLFDVENGSIRPYGVTRFKEIVYNDSEPWIEVAIRSFVESLRAKPVHTSVCRSVKTGYTPASRAAFIEKTLIDYLTGRQGRPIDPRDIPGRFEIYPFVACEENVLYVPLTDDTIKLSEDMRFIWRKIKEERSFSEIVNAMLKVYDLPPQVVVDQVVRFILRLKQKFVLK